MGVRSSSIARRYHRGVARTIAAALLVAACVGCSEGDADICAPAAAYPAPRLVHVDGITAAPQSLCVDADALALDATMQTTLDQAIAKLLTAAELRRGNDSECDWRVRLTRDTPAPDCAETSEWTNVERDEAWCAVTVVVDAGEAVSTITVQSARGALDALRALLAPGPVAQEGTIADAPAFALRGLVEGTYGGPWGDADRVVTLRLLASLGANAYLYAPKGDPLTNEKWASAYSAADLQPIADAAKTAREGLIRFYWGVSPGWRDGGATRDESIHYGSDDDFQRLTAKLDQLRGAGADGFALLLDDIDDDLAWPDDVATFGTLAAAQAFLANRLEEYVYDSTGNHLLLVGTHYWPDDNWRDYNATFGALLAPSITVLWTGPSVFSPTISAADLTDIDATLGRQVAIWDNEPSSVLPLSGRSPDLATMASGYLSNPTITELGENPIRDYWAVMGTAFDYAWNPTRYSPADSLWQWARVRSCREDRARRN